MDDAINGATAKTRAAQYLMDRDLENGCAGFDPLPQPSV